MTLEWIEGGHLVPFQSKCGLYRISRFVGGSRGPVHVAYFRPALQTLVACGKAKALVEEAMADAQRHRDELERAKNKE